jgi:hypothetical protein
MLTNTSRSVLASHGGSGNRRVQIARRDTHAKVHAPATRQSTRNIPSLGEIADYDINAVRS